MRVGIEFLYAQQDTTQGYDSALRNLLEGLDDIVGRHEVFIFCHSTFCRENQNKFSNLQLIDCGDRWRGRFKRAFWLSAQAPSLINKHALDVIYFPTHFRPIQKLPNVWTVFNVYDLQYLYYPDNFGHFQKLVRDFYYRLSLAKCDCCICISDFVRRTVSVKFPWIDSKRLVVIPIPVKFYKADELNKNKYFIQLPSRPYLLTVGKHFIHKNLDTLIRAFDILIRTGRYAGTLVIAGDFTSHTPELRTLAQELGCEDKVHFLGYVSDEIREHLYKCADAFVFPSLYEGFGMPLIEAMGRQIPVICSDTTSLPEVTMSLANYYTPACDVRSLAQVMEEVLTHLPSSQFLKETADRVQKRYGIATVAKQYLDLWESLVE